ncbi:hypothetical protein [Natrinema hispanicum]|nr:hypothetical protein [Natrinema hispanicum]
MIRIRQALWELEMDALGHPYSVTGAVSGNHLSGSPAAAHS